MPVPVGSAEVLPGPYKGTVEPQAASIAAAATPEAIRAKREVCIGVSLLFMNAAQPTARLM